MQTAQVTQIYNKNGQALSPATCIETLYFEQTYNDQVYRTSLNNRLLVVGNRLNAVTKNNISEALNKAQLPFYYITKIKSDTASGLYRLDVSLYSVNTAVKSTEIIADISSRIANVSTNLENKEKTLQDAIIAEHEYNSSTYVLKTGSKMSGGIVFGKGSDTEIKKLPGIGFNGDNLILAAPNDDAIISFWGSLSEEYGMNTPGVTWKKPSVQDNGKVPVYNYGSNNLVWSTYNAGSMNYTTADYGKYYILGITELSYQERDFGETTFIAKEGNIETNVYVSRKNVYANAFYASSDKALKTNIKSVDVSTYIPQVIQFNWLDTSQISYGFLAQDLEEHGLTYLMDKDDQDHWRVNYSAAISLVLGDLQKYKKESEEKIKKLEEENKNLKELYNTLAERISKLENKK